MSDTNNDVATGSMAERLKQLRKSLKLTQKDFADKLGMVPQAIGMMERSARKINKRQLKAICAVYNVNEEWLSDGNGEMFLKNEEASITKNTINDRLFELRNKLGLSQKDFGAQIGVSRDVIKNFDSKKTLPKPLQIKIICDKYNINEKWLTTGEGEMYDDISFDTKVARLVIEILSGGSSFEKCVIACLAKATPEERKVLEKIVTDLVHMRDEQKAKEEDNQNE